MADALCHGHHWGGDSDHLTALLRGYGVEDVLIKADVAPTPLLTKPRGFLDKTLDRVLERVIKTYGRLVGNVVNRLGKHDTDKIALFIRASHKAFAAGTINNKESDFIKLAFQAGRVGAWRADKRMAKSVSAYDLELDDPSDSLTAALRTVDRDFPLGPVEQLALDFARRKAGTHIVGLGNRIGANFETLAIETEHAVRRQLMGQIRGQVSDAIVRRRTARQLASALGNQLEDWARDMMRIARTELHFAHQAGWAAHYHATTGGETRVAKRIDDRACKHCRRLFLEADGTPKVFVLEELEANGTNVGRKAADWKATVGPVHPNCSCHLFRVPPGFGFNDEGQMVPV